MKTMSQIDRAYNVGYYDGLSAGMWAGWLGGIFLSILCAAVYHMARL
jgi:hypothetical protein